MVLWEKLIICYQQLESRLDFISIRILSSPGLKPLVPISSINPISPKTGTEISCRNIPAQSPLNLMPHTTFF